MKPQPNPHIEPHPAAEPENDDLPVGRVWSRKEVFTLFGGAAGMLLFAAGCGGGGSSSGGVSTGITGIAAATPTPATSPSASSSATATPTPSASTTPTPMPTGSVSCVATPQLTEGPYWVDEMLNRSDVRTDPTTGVAKAGTPLVLNLVITNVNGACSAISGATVDIWHCDASGVYSDEAANSTSGQKFLRGYQTTDANGAAQFTTIYPGWYAGRAVHIHFRVRATISGKSYNFTSQLFFDDSLTDTVFATQAPYASRGSQRTTRNTNDNIYQSQMQMVLTPSAGSGYAANFVVGLSV